MYLLLTYFDKSDSSWLLWLCCGGGGGGGGGNDGGSTGKWRGVFIDLDI